MRLDQRERLTHNNKKTVQQKNQTTPELKEVIITRPEMKIKATTPPTTTNSVDAIKHMSDLMEIVTNILYGILFAEMCVHFKFNMHLINSWLNWV